MNPLLTPTSWNPLGAALQAYRAGREDAIIMVDNSVQENEELEVAYFFRDPTQPSHMEKELLSRCKNRVLDIGAGAGVHALFLQNKGKQVTALDVSPEAVEIMREQGVEDAHCADVFEWEGGPYDSLLMLMNGIGIVGTLERLRTFLEKAKTLLAPYGSILLESTDIIYAYTAHDGSITFPGDRYYGEIEYKMTFDGKAGDPFPWLYVDPGTLALYAEEAGFSCEIIHLAEEYNYTAELRKV